MCDKPEENKQTFDKLIHSIIKLKFSKCRMIKTNSGAKRGHSYRNEKSRENMLSKVTF